MNVAPLRDELGALSDGVWQRLLDRLDGLTDDEYFWEPVPGSWTVRAGPGGVWTWDCAWPEPDPPPHDDDRLAAGPRDWSPMTGSGRGSGSAPSPGRHPPTVPSSARATLDTVTATKAQRRRDLTEVTDADLWERIGPIGGPCAARPRVAWVLHALDDVIHHGAEIGLLRDLYRGTNGR